MKEIVLATNNEHKIKEIIYIMGDLPLRIRSKKDFPNFPEIEETGKTLEENAILKARAINKFSGLSALADDSGLEIPALGGAPGVNSARYAGPECSFRDNNEKLLKEMKAIPPSERQATFRCVVAICFGREDLEVVQGKLVGQIATEMRGKNGFGYDPIFWVPIFQKTLAELSAQEKNRISHRSLALMKAREILIKKFALGLTSK